MYEVGVDIVLLPEAFHHMIGDVDVKMNDLTLRWNRFLDVTFHLFLHHTAFITTFTTLDWW